MPADTPAPRLPVWVAAGLCLDLAAWAVLRRVGILAGNPGTASALAICLVHSFVLPAVSTTPRDRRLAAGLVTGCLAAPLAFGLGLLAGVYTGSVALLLLFAVSPPDGADVPYSPPGPVLDAVLGAFGVVVAWSGFVAGSMVAAVTAALAAALVPGLRRPRLSWRLTFSGGCAAIIALPDWDLPFLRPPWREPALLLAAALPNLLLVGPRQMVTNPSRRNDSASRL